MKKIFQLKFFQSKFFKSKLFFYIRAGLISLLAFLVVENGVLLYINNYYLKDNGEYVAKIITPSSSAAAIKGVSVTSGAQNLACSHDGRYVAYLENGVVSVIDMTNSSVYHIDSIADMQVSYFKWVYDRDRLIIAQKPTAASGKYTKLYYYDMKDRALTEIRDNTNDKSIELSMGDAADQVSDYDMSTTIVKAYVKITSQSGKSKLWTVDAYGGGADVRGSTVTTNIGKIQSLKTQDKLIYENKDNGKVYLYGKSTPITAGGNTNLSIVGFDSSDNVYLALTNGGATNTIYHGSYDSDEAKWNFESVSLSASVNIGNVYVGLDGSIYYVDEASSAICKAWPKDDGTSSVSSSSSSSSKPSSQTSSMQVSSITSNGGIKFTGKVIGIFDKGFVTIYNDQITPHKFS